MLARSPTHHAARIYASRGWHCFPLEPVELGNPKSGKAPLSDHALRLFNGKNQATTALEVIDKWWYAHPNAGIGIALDKSNLVALDVDVGPIFNADGTQLVVDGVPQFKPGRKSLEEFDAHLPETLTAITGSGGLHAIFDAEGVPAHAIELRKGLDLIGNGYIVAAPSPHWSGGTYRWHLERPIAPLPAILRQAVRLRAEEKKVQLNESTGTPIDSGGRNQALFRLGCVLRDQGIGVQALAAAMHHENQLRCKPPLDDRELMLLVDSVMKRVTPSRDAAAGALLEQEVAEALAPPPPPAASKWLYEIADSEEPPVRFYESGFPQMDAMIGGGLATRQVFGVIGNPSSGKTAFVTSINDHLQSQMPVLHFTTELTFHETVARYAALRKNFPWRDGISAKISREVKREAIKDLRVRVVAMETLDRENPLAQIEYEARRMHQMCGTMPAITVDYVQMLASGGDDRKNDVGSLTMGLRILAQQLDTVLLAVFASRRDFYGGGKLELLREADDPTLFLAAAKECGDIEFHCATLVFLDVDKLAPLPKPARIAVARARIGDPGFAGARAQLDIGRWYGDPAAAVEMTGSARKEKQNLGALEADMLKLLDIIARMPNRAWRDLRSVFGGAQRADMARAELMKSGRIEEVDFEFYDSNHRKQKRRILRVVPGTPETIVPVEVLP